MNKRMHFKNHLDKGLSPNFSVTFISVIISLVLLLGCGHRKPITISTSTSIFPNTKAIGTILVDYAPSITLTQQPPLASTFQPPSTPIPTPRPHLTFTPSSTPYPTEYSLFPVLSEEIGTGGVWPTDHPPIATPDLLAQGYRLKLWSESDAVALAQQLDLYASESDIGSGPVRSGIQMAQAYIKLSLQEAFYRFPELENDPSLKWRQALADAMTNSSASDSWMISQIQHGLDEGRYFPDKLDQLFAGYGFKVLTPIPADNLFGDGAKAWVYSLQTRNSWTRDGIVFAVSERPNGHNQVDEIFSQWIFCGGSSSILDVADHNHNGMPEVALYSGGLKQGPVLIFEWLEGHWEELTHNQITLGEYGSFEYGDSDENDNATLVVKNFVYSVETYKWNGQYYELVNVDYGDRPAEQLYGLNTSEEYDQRIALIQEILAAWPNVGEPDAGTLGPSYPDYLRFQLGFNYALQAKATEARVVFRSLVDAPTNPQIAAVSQAAEAFLNEYHTDTDLYRACQSAQQIMNGFITPYRETKGYVTPGEVISAWGLNGDYAFHSQICNMENAFVFLVQASQQGQLPSNPIPFLQESGVNTKYSVQIDLDLDGDLDWISAVNSIGTFNHSAPRMDIWAMSNVNGKIEAQHLNELINVYGEYNSGPYIFQVVAPMKIARPILISQLGQNIQIYRVNRSNRGEILEKVLEDGPVQQFMIQKGETTVDIEIFYTEPTYSLPYYRWDAQTGHFSNIDRITELLLVEGNPPAALSILQMILSKPEYRENVDPPYGRPRLLYLLGLSYELMGNEDEAVETYWHLWKDYPWDGYAIMARSKLELANGGENRP